MISPTSLPLPRVETGIDALLDGIVAAISPS